MRSRFPVGIVSVVAAFGLLVGPGAASSGAPGSLDDTFSGDGKVRVSFKGHTASADDVLVYHRRILAGGAVRTPDDSEGSYVLTRLLPDGTLDKSFSNNGKTTLPFKDDGAVIARYLSRRVVVAQFLGRGLTMVRYRWDGTRDASFGGDGKVTVKLDGVWRVVLDDVFVRPTAR